jgi:hypothetical protein
VSRRIRSFLLCLAAGAILPLAVPGVASSAPKAAAPAAQTTAAATSGIPTHFAGGCESGHHTRSPDPLTDLLQNT